MIEWCKEFDVQIRSASISSIDQPQLPSGPTNTPIPYLHNVCLSCNRENRFLENPSSGHTTSHPIASPSAHDMVVVAFLSCATHTLFFATSVNSFCRRRRRPRAPNFVPFASASAAGGATSGANPWKSRERSDSTSSDSTNSETANPAQFTDEESVTETTPPPKPVATSNAAALQVDDGSLSQTSSYTIPIPRKLVRKQQPSLRIARKTLLSSFQRSVLSAVVLLSLFVTWYGSNAMFNVYNKRVLRVFPYPLTCTVAQFAIGAVVMISLWLTKAKRAPPAKVALLTCVTPLAVCHAAGFLLTNMSLGKVSVAFTHTVKATEPFFSAALTPSILGDIPTWGIVGSLVPIVGGVALASATDASFNWVGFLCAVGSNIALQSRNVLSKKLMKDKSDGDAQRGRERAQVLESLDNVNLFATMTVFALLVLAPVALLWEGAPLATAAAAPAATGMSTTQLWWMLAMGGACRCLDVLSSYMILNRVSPVTHSVGNCVKRAVVIAVSIVIFKTPMTWVTALGTCLALAGVLLYSMIVAGCKQNTFGPDSPMCRPVYEKELQLVEGGGI